MLLLSYGQDCGDTFAGMSNANVDLVEVKVTQHHAVGQGGIGARKLFATADDRALTYREYLLGLLIS
jgi:hypothetical protein